eukprot:3529494-Pyramimonas_sp.AAC.1
MKLFAPRISFMNHGSLSIGMGSAMVTMRRELRRVLTESMEYRHGAPPPNYRNDVQSLLDVFWHSPEKLARLRRTIVEALFAGDLEGQTIVHWCAGCCSGREDCLAKFLVYGAQALCGAAPKPFSVHRWARQEHAVNWIGVFEGRYRLFTRVFIRFCAKVASKLARVPRHVPANSSWDQRAAAIEDEPDGGPAAP